MKKLLPEKVDAEYSRILSKEEWKLDGTSYAKKRTLTTDFEAR